ncbi:MAG TPA: DUF4388 domain-containing protein [Candidatus Obscuribacterales bacterium]
MLGSSKPPPGQGKIRLPKLQSTPTLENFQYMCEQAHANFPREVEQVWGLPGSNKMFSLGVKYERGVPHPVWTLWEDSGGTANLVWKQESSDYQLIDDMVSMASPANPSTSSSNLAAATPSQPGFTKTDWEPGATDAFQRQFGSSSTSQSGMSPFESQFGRAATSSQGLSALSPTGERVPGHGPVFVDKQAAPAGVAGFDGTIDKIPMSSLVDSISNDGLTGRLEVLGDESVGEIYFLNGVPMFAQVAGILGDNAVRELLTWRTGTFAFFPGDRTEIRNIHKKLNETIMEGIALLDKKKHLERLGLTPDAYLVKKHRNLSDTEIKLYLSKGEPADLNYQFEVYKSIGHKYSLSDLLRDRPMESADWVPLVFNFLTCDLIEIRPPDAVKVGALDFLEEAKIEVDAIYTSMLRPETGVLAYPGFLLFLQHEFYRFEAYGWPMSLILFEMNRKKDYDSTAKEGSLRSSVELLPPQAVTVAAKRIELVKRPLDVFGHYETLEFALLLPNTKVGSASYVANRILQTLTISPLSPQIDKKTLKLAFGIANLPADGETLYDLLSAVRSAKDKAVAGNFPIVISKSVKSS